jgi:subtilisin family serine protease
MKRIALLFILLTLLVGVFSISVVSAQRPSRQYLVLANTPRGVPAALLNQIRAAGGSVLKNLSQVGLVVASTDNPNFEAMISTARAVVPVFRHERPTPRFVTEVIDPPNIPPGGDDPRVNFQWGLDAVEALEAHSVGRTGGNTRVAILDSGIDADHPDLAANVNAALSVSFIPGEDWNPPPTDPDGFSVYFDHGTHVAGIVAAARNATGVVGVAPDAELVAVKVCFTFSPFCDDNAILNGIVYAADIGADVANMSFGATFDIRGACDDPNDPNTCYTTQDVIDMALIYHLVTSYAYSKGTTLIASAGNGGHDFDAEWYLVKLPAQLPSVISISATAPDGWALDPNTDLDVPTSYTDFGRRLVDFSAPGGDFDLPGEDPCLVAGLVRPCWVFDMVISDIPGPALAWAAGTSMAAPHATGVAALYVTDVGGSLPPAIVYRALQVLSDRVPGGIGRDPYLGWGRVDATQPDSPDPF